MALSIGTNVVIISIIFSVLAIALVLVRFYSRKAQRVPFGIDDYLIIPATFLAVGIGISNSISQCPHSMLFFSSADCPYAVPTPHVLAHQGLHVSHTIIRFHR